MVEHQVGEQVFLKSHGDLIIMCATYCDYGYFTDEDVKEAQENYKGEFYTEWDLISLDNSVSRYKNEEDYDLIAITEAIKLKVISPDKRVMVKEEYWCSGTEVMWALEIISEKEALILCDFHKVLPEILTGLNINYKV
jgi:hypothetical protein